MRAKGFRESRIAAVRQQELGIRRLRINVSLSLISRTLYGGANPMAYFLVTSLSIFG